MIACNMILNNTVTSISGVELVYLSSRVVGCADDDHLGPLVEGSLQLGGVKGQISTSTGILPLL